MAKLDLALCCGVVFLVAVAGSTRAQTDPRADIVVYGDHAFTTFRDGVSFQNPRDYREDGDDPITRLKYETVPGMQNVLGTVQWGSEAYGKYVLLGDYKSIFQTAADQRIGIFDSERKTFCSLDVDPNVVGTQGSQRTLIAANPIARQSRIFFAGNGSVIGSSLGFIRADLDVDDPCTWQVTLISPAAMNGSLPPAKQPCPNNACEFDGLGLLAHEDVPGDPYGRDTIVVGDYYSPRVSVIQVGATGVTALDTYLMPHWVVPSAHGGMCYTANMVQIPSIDAGRAATDRRFNASFDSFPISIYDDAMPAACAPPVPYCPKDVATDGLPGAPCPGGGICGTAYCAKTFFGSYLGCTPGDPQACTAFGGDFGPCQTSCLPLSPFFTCTNSSGGGSGRRCVVNANCPSGETCTSQQPGVKPTQEFRFDGTTLAPVSGMVLAESGSSGIAPMGYFYDSQGGAWFSHNPGTQLGYDVAVYDKKASGQTCNVNGGTQAAVAGEHCYYNPGAARDTAVIVPPDHILPFEYVHSPGIYNWIGAAYGKNDVGSGTYLVGRASIQRAARGYGQLILTSDTVYKVGLGSGLFPAEPKACSSSGVACETVGAACAGNGGICQAEPESAVVDVDKLIVSVGGSPPSLWTAVRFATNAANYPANNLYLIKVPIPVNIPDGLSTVPPGVAWSGDRLWMVAEHDGVLKYRIRDDGLWSGWSPLPTNVALAGGAAVLSGGGWVELFARGATDHKVYTTKVTSLTCAPGSCSWENWALVPGSPSTDSEPAVAYQGTAYPFLVVRNSSDGGGVYYTRRFFGSWTGVWTRINGVTAASAPTVAWQGTLGKFWVAVNESQTGKIRVTRDALAATPTWEDAGSSGSQAPWLAAPTLVFDGQSMRVFTSAGAFPNYVYQAAHDGSGWTSWKVPVSQAITSRALAATVVNGDISLVTNWLNYQQESFVK